MEMNPALREFIRRLPGIISALGQIIGGIYVFMHDAHDFGKFSHDGQKKGISEYMHHWYWGLIMIIMGLITLGAILVDYFLSLQELSSSP